MIKDLKQAGTEVIERATPVCIIGAGTAGIFLSQILREHGIEVILLEAGDAHARLADEVGQRCIQTGIRYRGADAGRSFGLGGTSALWGGQLIPLMPSDMGERPSAKIAAWPIDYAELAAYLPSVKSRLGLRPRTDSDDCVLLQHRFATLSRLDADFQLRLSEWLPFKTRNFAKAFASELRTDPGLELWLNASVVGMHLAPDVDPPRLDRIEARNSDGQTLIVRPKVVVVCAGALESTRLMLAFDESSGGLISRNGAPLGRYFSDHLSITAGRFQCRDWRRYSLETAPIFAHGVMRTPRLEFSPSAQARLTTTSAFAHFTFLTHGETGFDVVRNFLRQRQGERRGLGLSPALLGRVITDISAMAFWRGWHRRLWIPRLADLLLQIDIEQSPNWESRLSLSDERDALQRKRLVIDWRIKPDDARIVRTVAERMLQAWKASSLREVARLELTLPEAFEDLESLYDVYHPTGTLCMGRSPADSVVDRDLRLWAVDNAYVSSTAVFPSAGSANPGLMHLSLTARLAEQLAKRLK